MEAFLNEIIEGEKFELTIDTKIFPKEIILKTAYVFLDRGYFFFKLDGENIILQFTKKENNNEKPELIIADFSDELLSTLLRDNLEKENKEIREKIVGAAIANSIDPNGYTSFDTNVNLENNQESNQIDFDKDIDDILKEIENDPELKIDEEEIEKILKEIEEETENEINEKPNIVIDPEAVKKAKENFKK